MKLGGSFFRYLLVGGGMSALDLGLFSLFAVAFGVPEIPSNVASTIITVLVSYQLNRRFVFQGARSGWQAFFSFAGLTLVTGLLVQSFIVWGVISLGVAVAPGLPHGVLAPAAKVVAMGVGALCNYFGYRFILEPRRQQA
ncbi:GtrA family protein [Leucobacter sp. HY1910]